MARDYAQRQKSQRSKSQNRRKKRQPTRRRASNKVNAGFNAPSFSAGVIFGAVLVLVGSYAPEIFDESVTTIRAVQTEAVGDVTFEFDQLLKNDVVVTDPDAYRTEFEPAGENAGSAKEFLLQAAAFRSSEDAERLRANLLMLNLPATTGRVDIASGTWYRVTVGPFDSRVKADRALTRLRENNLSALLVKRD